MIIEFRHQREVDDGTPLGRVGAIPGPNQGMERVRIGEGQGFGRLAQPERQTLPRVVGQAHMCTGIRADGGIGRDPGAANEGIRNCVPKWVFRRIGAIKHTGHREGARFKIVCNQRLQRVAGTDLNENAGSQIECFAHG